ncbi:hypothetical protein TWF569_010218 [Orbilia oligospora]|nr:hypothetical protein TWF103_004406 [Orbilia oligospora]KAF3134339.1 hypothetical protein TWF569_010218 [Orbilia oligospora]
MENTEAADTSVADGFKKKGTPKGIEIALILGYVEVLASTRGSNQQFRQIECEHSNGMDTTAGLDAPPLKDPTSQYGYLVYSKTRPTSIVFLGSTIYDLSLASYTSPSGRTYDIAILHLLDMSGTKIKILKRRVLHLLVHILEINNVEALYWQAVTAIPTNDEALHVRHK